MKKLISILLALISVICVAFSFAACGDEEVVGEFYTVTEAYENGYLTREDVMNIAYYQDKDVVEDETIIDENYVPLPKTPEQLSAKTEKAIKQTYLNEYLSRINDATLSDVTIYKYYGTYNGCVAVMIESVLMETLLAWTEEVDGIDIYYSDGKEILIWRKV